MTEPDQYLKATLLRHTPDPTDPPNIHSLLKRWPLYPYLQTITPSGSHPKNTALRNSDTDLLISLSPQTPGTLQQIQQSLLAHVARYQPKLRNVAIQITHNNATLDLTPARRQENSTSHTLWQHRHNTILQTDIQKQIDHVRNSNRTEEIRLLKLWRHRHQLKFPSFYLELTVIQALMSNEAPNRPLSDAFLTLLKFLSTDFPTTTLRDPANPNNKVSDTLTAEEKQKIHHSATLTLTYKTWPEIL